MSPERAWLRTEVPGWVADGLVAPEQAQRILERYEGPEPAPGSVDRSAWGKVTASGNIVAAISVIGAVLLGLGVILFFAANWDAIPKPLRIVLLFGTTAATYYAGYELQFRRKNFPKTGEAVIFLGGLFYGGSLFLTAQIFNVNSGSISNLLLLWLAGTLPLAYVLRSPWTSALNVVLFTIWANIQLGDVRPSPPTEAFAMLNVTMGALYYAAGRAQATFALTRMHALAFRALGALIVAAAMYVLTFGGFFNERVPKAPTGGVLGIHLAMIGLAAATIGYAHLRASQRGEASLLESGLLAAIVLYAGLYLAAPDLAGRLVANLALAAFIVALIVVGYRSRDVALVNLALAFAAIDIVTRYFDLFYDFLPRSLFFIVGGALLLAGAFYGERERRKLIQTLRGGAA